MTATPPLGGGLGALLAAVLVAAAIALWPGSGRAATVSGSGNDPRSRFCRPSWLRRLTGSPDRDDDIVHLVEAVGAALSAGLGPADALRLVTDSRAGGRAGRSEVDDVLPSLVLRARSGDTLSQGWHEVADRLGSTQVRLLARAWALSESSGAPLASAASTAAHLLRAKRDRRRRSQAAVAGARATIRILTLLPLGGPVLAALLGLDLARLYAQSPAVWACVGGGLALIVVGRWWVGRLVAGAVAGPMLT